jgi:hypothetical protein
MDLPANAFDVFNEDAKVVLCRDRNAMRRSRHCLGGATVTLAVALVPRRKTGTEKRYNERPCERTTRAAVKRSLATGT